MELLFLLKSSKLIKPKRMMKERYHSVNVIKLTLQEGRL